MERWVFTFSRRHYDPIQHQVKEEVSVLVQEADEIMGGAKGLLVGFDVVCRA